MNRICRRIGMSVLLALAAIALLGAVGQQVLARHVSCSANLKQLSYVMQMYALDYDGKLPTMPNEKRFQNELAPYTRESKLFTCPDSDKPYVPTRSMGGKLLKQIKKPETVLLLRDAKPHSDSMYNLLYADGHQARIDKLPKPAPNK